MNAAGEDMTLAEMRRELHRLVSIADSAERPKPTCINPADHAMPGHEWIVQEQRRPYGERSYAWVVRTTDDAEVADGLVYVSSPDCMYPGEDFTPMYSTDARRLAMALLAAADRAEHQALGVPRLEDHRGPATTDHPRVTSAGHAPPTDGDRLT